MKRKSRIIFFVAVFCFLLLVPIEHFWGSKINSLEKQSEEFLVGILPKKVIYPDPLRFEGDSFSSKLSREGVFQFTNKERKTLGLPLLKLNTKLNHASELKVEDMFKKEYFAHISPEGIGASDLVKTVEYDYILIGENLALGNFKDDEELLRAWMESPGHRANILNKRYEEIGIALKKAEFEGVIRYLAVQTFGVPASSCPSPSSTLKEKIRVDKEKLSELELLLGTKKSEIETMEPKRGSDYNKKINGYNLSVNEYNALVETTKKLISDFNAEVKKYNACAEGV